MPPDVARFTQTGDLIMTRELGATSPRAVGDRNAAFMVTTESSRAAPTSSAGVMAAVLLERACRTNIRALAGGGPKTWSSDEEALVEARQLLAAAAPPAGLGLLGAPA